MGWVGGCSSLHCYNHSPLFFCSELICSPSSQLSREQKRERERERARAKRPQSTEPQSEAPKKATISSSTAAEGQQQPPQKKTRGPSSGALVLHCFRCFWAQCLFPCMHVFVFPVRAAAATAEGRRGGPAQVGTGTRSHNLMCAHTLERTHIDMADPIGS